MSERSRFVLIGGMPRSGTNLMRRVVGSHSRIAIAPSELWLFKKYADGRSIDRALARPKLADLGLDLGAYRGMSYRDAYVRMLLDYAERCGKDIAGEKTPLSEFYYPIIEEWLRDFDHRFIHMVRDPFDAIASLKHAPFIHRKGGLGLRNIRKTAEGWRRSASLGLARARELPGRYHLLRIEELTADPTAATNALCDFLGVDFEEERMLGLADYTERRDNTSFDTQVDGSTPVDGSAARIRRLPSRRDKLEAAEIATIREVCGELAQAMGYPDPGYDPAPFRTPNPLSLSQRITKIARNKRRSRSADPVPTDDGREPTKRGGSSPAPQPESSRERDA